jgi:hypothetical protein
MVFSAPALLLTPDIFVNVHDGGRVALNKSIIGRLSLVFENEFGGYSSLEASVPSRGYLIQ